MPGVPRRRALVWPLALLGGAGAVVATGGAETAGASGTVPGAPVRASGAVEAAYAAAGPHAVTAELRPGYVLVRPRVLGAGGFRHPVLTWGNGSGNTPLQYGALLARLASWGFVVVASVSGRVGTGAELLAGVRQLASENARRGSVFHGRLDLGRVGAVGHSQGAGGAVNATVQSGGLITVTVCVALPAPVWVAEKDRFHVERLAGPVLFLGGGRDLVSAPPWDQRGYFDRVPGPAAVGVLRQADHGGVEGDGGGFRGYLTAWLRYHLCGDSAAGAAFTGPAPEFTANPAWQDQAVKNLDR
ncbi:hypothetical protein RKE29_12105 [Streptomyces sp. B1866]|uniref:poly(ethylene terephthalate) hydrolase family protein n=1 Tax=Streptomyces sp. B1866 TaxID=3075431 RepID=UPI00288E01CE|nr:hypothetical protein [Streptomyces sp. B1866]MDT3397382.1 hypothetical protein [Streptomyces sp. B1866]